MKSFMDLRIFKKLANKEHITVVALGSSNTQRRLPGMTWFDFVELGFKSKYGKGCGNFINVGIGGDRAIDILARFDRDVTPFKPDLAILTVGGNDSNPANGIEPDDYKKTLHEIYGRISALGAETIFQTYYACKLECLPPGMPDRMNLLMEYVRETAENTNSVLNDNYARWGKLREKRHSLYELLMKDAMHVNAEGNMVIGLDLTRNFGIEFIDEWRETFKTGFFVQALLDII